MRVPCSTGEAARFLGTTEPRLAETVRRGRVKPPPAIVAGRRLWLPAQLAQAASLLGLLTNQLAERLGGLEEARHFDGDARTTLERPIADTALRQDEAVSLRATRSGTRTAT